MIPTSNYTTAINSNSVSFLTLMALILGTTGNAVIITADKFACVVLIKLVSQVALVTNRGRRANVTISIIANKLAFVLVIKIVSFLTLPAVTGLVTKIAIALWRANNLALAINQSISSIALKTEIGRSAKSTVKIEAVQLALSINELVAFKTFVALVTRSITDTTARIHTAKNTDAFNGSVSPVTHTADVLWSANVTVLIIANKLAFAVHNFITFMAESANVGRAADSAMKIGATKMAHLLIFHDKFKITGTEHRMGFITRNI